MVFLGSSDGYVYGIQQSEQKAQLFNKYKTADNIETAPLITGKHLLTGSGEYLYCFIWQTGELLWKSERLPGKVVANIIVANDTVYVATTPGGVSALYLTSGKRRWNVPILGGVETGLVLSQNTLWAGGNEKDIYGIDAQSGQTVFMVSTSFGFSGVPLLVRKTIFFAGKDFRIYAISTENGKRLWEHPLAERVFARPACDNTYLYVCAGKSLQAFWVEDFLK
jgi:outer membrane protein assembly factor BamB